MSLRATLNGMVVVRCVMVFVYASGRIKLTTLQVPTIMLHSRFEVKLHVNSVGTCMALLVWLNVLARVSILLIQLIRF